MIRIQNIYHMLSYAYQVLREQGYASIATEEFENTADLLSAILVKGIGIQVKRGLGRAYVEKTESLSCLRGKIDVSESIKTQTMIKRQLVCSYDEFSVNMYFNKILKTTMEVLLQCDLSKKRKKELRNLLPYFKEVDVLDKNKIQWNQRFYRNNQSYKMLINTCYLILNGLLQTEEEGTIKLQKYLDEQRMCKLYEKFILEYYRKEFPMLTVNASQIPWQLDDGFNTMLPIMQSDIMLSYEDETLIIDAKYYSHTTQSQYNTNTLHSNNLYQIFTYVKNKDIGNTGKVSGMLLYAKTEESINLDQAYFMSGNKISVKTLNLDCEFNCIKEQLNRIVIEQFNI